MNISVQRDINACVSEYFTQTLNIKSQLNAPCRKRMTERMKSYGINFTLGSNSIEPIFHAARFHKSVFFAGKHKSVFALPFSL